MQHYVLKMVGQPDIIATKTGVFSVKHVAYIMERRKIMISFILCLLLLTILFGIAYKITGAILKACVWLLILLPIGLILSGVGVIFCCTIILIPVGIGIIKAGIRMILPGYRNKMITDCLMCGKIKLSHIRQFHYY